MDYNPHTHMALARARQEDMIRDARKHELARQVSRSDGPGLASRLAGLLHLHRHRRHPAVPAVAGR